MAQAIEKASAPRSGAHTVIGSSIVIDGEISGDEDLVIQGTVKGKISLKESLYVESSGVIEADIDTANVEVSGQVTSNIAASDKACGAACRPLTPWSTCACRLPRLVAAGRGLFHEFSGYETGAASDPGKIVRRGTAGSREPGTT